MQADKMYEICPDFLCDAKAEQYMLPRKTEHGFKGEKELSGH